MIKTATTKKVEAFIYTLQKISQSGVPCGMLQRRNKTLVTHYMAYKPKHPELLSPQH